MTPDDVVARAKELVGQEVLLTLRGQVERSVMSGRLHFVTSPGSFSALVVLDPEGVSRECLVDIQPAPLRIEPGELYEVPGFGLCRGQADGGLWAMDAARALAADAVAMFDGIKRVKVVDA